jgi:gluconokinase
LRNVSQGVSGTGKSTLGKTLADRLGFPFIDGDDLHPKDNIEKMSRGEALNDQDRLPWLGSIRETGVRRLEEQIDHRNEPSTGKPTTRDVGVVMVCSSLKGFYREILRGNLTVEQAPETRPGEIAYQIREADRQPSSKFLPQTYFVWITGDRETLKNRILNRQGHFFEAKMLDSQFEALESPEGEPDVVIVPLEPSTEQQTKIALEKLWEISETESVT